MSSQFRKGQKPNLRHGMLSFLAVGSLPKGASYVTKSMRRFRAALDAAVVAAHGELSLAHAAVAQTAVRHEVVSLLAQRWLRLRFDSLSDADRLAYARQIAASSDARDKAIRSLGLNRADTGRQIIDVLYDGSPSTAASTTDGGDDDRDSD